MPVPTALPADGVFPDDQPASPVSPIRRRLDRRIVILAAIGAAAYCLALLAQLPAAFLISRGDSIAALGGTIWHGEAALAGGDRLEWRWAPLRTLANLAFAVDFTVEGDGTGFGGRALLGASSVRLDDVSGTGDARLLRALAPGLGFTCRMPLAIALEQVTLGGGTRRIVGQVTSGAGACSTRGGAIVPVEPLVFAATPLGRATSATIAPTGQRRRSLATLLLAEDGKATFAVTRDGAAVLPFAAPAGGVSIETEM